MATTPASTAAVWSAAVDDFRTSVSLLRKHDPNVDLCTVEPTIVLGLFAAAFSALCWLLSLPTRNFSWVDRLWTLCPVVYALYIAILSPSPRLVLAALLITAWGFRLTYNFARKGGYKPSSEDYRWAEIRKRVGPTVFEVFNFFFIAIYQHILLLLLVLPLYVAWRAEQAPGPHSFPIGFDHLDDPHHYTPFFLFFAPVCYALFQNLMLPFFAGTIGFAYHVVQSSSPIIRNNPPLNLLDVVAAVLFVGLLTLETVADNQQWRFQKAKHALKPYERTGDFKRGFLTSGLFRYSRHPNFFAEQAMWWTVYLFSVAATGVWLNWSIIGPVLLTLLFQASTILTETLSSAKYPEYMKYQRTTSRFIPLPPRTPATAFEKME